MTEIKQRTIGSSVSLSGNGLHTGSAVNLVFRPAESNSGIVFIRTDIGPDARVEADALLVSDTSRGTTIEKNGVKVVTIEHVMAAAAGLQIDNLIIELDGPELPIMDGSSIAFVRALQGAGIVEQDHEREIFEVREPIRFYHQEKDCEIIALPSENFRVSCMIDYGSKVLGHQHASLNNIEDFASEIAPCRTFVFLHELEYLVNQNLIRGGDLSNAIVFVEHPVSPESIDRLSKLFNKPKVEVLPQGMLNNVECYFDNEPARHKLLDVIGDLALAGRPIKGHIIASRPGHESNVLFAKEIKKRIREQKLADDIPVYDPSKPVVYDIMGIQRLLPHRHPFLFVDKIIDIGADYVVGVKNVTMNEAFFTGHFPAEPVMPGVLIVEAMAQTGGILVLSPVDDPENYHTYFLKIDNVKFKQKVVPGDTLVFKLSLLSPVRRGICHMKGMAYVGNKLVMEAELMAQVGKNQ